VKFAISFVAAVLLAAPGHCQSIESELVCSKVMPSLLEFTGSVSTAMDAFSDMHDSKMSPGASADFDAVATKGRELKQVAEEYRKLFVLACYGN
jgi:hypothetical protein